MIKYPSNKTLEINIADFRNGLDTETAENITSFNNSVECYNFSFKSGALTESVGFEDLSIPTTIEENSTESYPIFADGSESKIFKKISHFKVFWLNSNKREDRLIAIADDNRVMFCLMIGQYPGYYYLDQDQYQEVPQIINYNDGTRDCVLFTSETDGLNSWDANAKTKKYTNGPIVTNMCIYKNRVFITEGGERLHLRTEPTNLTTWTNAINDTTTIINLDSERGYINKLLVFNGYLFAVRDFGITRVLWYDNDEKYNISHLFCSGSRMYGETACICGNIGLVFCKDGLYQFDNLSAEKIDLKLDKLLEGVSNKNAVASFRNGSYYLACRLNFNDGQKIGCENGDYKNNALITYEVATGNYSISRGVDICNLCTIQYESFDKLLACFNSEFTTKVGQLNNKGQFFGNVQKRYWRTPLTDLGYPNKNKYIKEVSLLSKYDAKVCVFTDSESREFNIKGNNLTTKIPVRIKGKQVGMSISSESEKSFISNVKLTVDLLDSEYV